MKNSATCEIKDINIVIEGQPVNIQGCTIHYENEASVQELATGSSFIKDMIHEIKDMVKEARASAQQYTPTPIASTTAKTTDENKVETPKTEQHWDLQAIWSVMVKTLPEGFKKSGIGHYTYESGSLKEKNRIRIVVCFKPESIDCDITVKDSTAFCHLYEDGTEGYISGVNPGLMEELIEELPEDVRGFIANYIKKVLNK